LAMAPRRLGVADAARITPIGETGPFAVRFVPGMNCLAYLRPDGDSTVSSLWLHPLDGAKPRLLLAGSAEAYTPAEELRRERARIIRDGVNAFQTAPGGGAAVFLARTGLGFCRGDADGAFAPWPGLDGQGVDDARLLPDGDRVVYAADGEVGLAHADGRRVVLDRADADGVSVGLADFAAAEELGRHEGLWPSPDGRWLAYARVDARAIEPLDIVHSADAVPWTERVRYPFAGGANASVEIWLADLEGAVGGGPPRRLASVGADRYLARVDWTPDGDLAVLLFSRDQHAWTWYALPPGGAEARVLAEAAGRHWQELPAGYELLAGDRLLATRERDGHTHLAIGGPEREWRFLTAGDWDVTALCDVDERQGQAVIQATANLGRERQLVRVDLESGAQRPLTSDAGCHEAVFAPEHDRFVLRTSSRAHPPWTYLCDRDGGIVATIHADADTTAEALGLTPPQLVEIAADDGTRLNAALYLPPGKAQPGRAAAVSVYGGPHAQRVREDWSLTSDLRAQYLAQQGVVVLKVDNRGSDGRGPAFARAVEGGFATVELDDQVAGVRFLIENAGVEPARVGIYGWSYGGFMTLHALLRRPDVFCVGVSGAPVTDFARYDTAYTERHLGTPEANPAAYAQAAVLPLAGRLARPLLVIHGLVDENVHFAHTARLVRALIAADRAFELAVLPTSRHMPRDAATRRLVERRTVGWLLGHLAPEAAGEARAGRQASDAGERSAAT
jgi:dipeptidyl-peptidase 4